MASQTLLQPSSDLALVARYDMELYKTTADDLQMEHDFVPPSRCADSTE